MVNKNDLYVELNSTVADALLGTAHVPIMKVGQQPIVTELRCDSIIFPNSKSYLIVTPKNWHSGWKKLKEPTIRLVIDNHHDRKEFITTSPAIDKDTLFKNKFSTYRIPYENKTPFLLNNDNFSTIINHSSENSVAIDVVLPVTYSVALAYFKETSRLMNKY